MKIAGFVKNSLIDYPGKITAIVFTQGCNFRCPFCHNPDLVPKDSKNPYISEIEIFELLERRKNLLEAVTITGGEPTLQPDLGEFISKVKSMGYFVKLDTNGTSPLMLKRIVEEGNVDYLAMDIKSSFEKYPEITGAKDTENIKKSIEIIMNSGLEYEFRTTVLPALHTEKDFIEIGKMIKGANKYFIQNFRPDNTLDKKYKNESSFTTSELLNIEKMLDKYVKSISIRENI